MIQAIPLTLWPPEKLSYILQQALVFRPWFSDYLWQQDEAAKKTAVAAYLVDAQSRAWEVYKDDQLVGLVLCNHIRIPLDAQCHFLFWDKSLIDKRELCRSMMRWAFTNLPVVTLRVEIPTYARHLLGFVRKALRFRYEAEGRGPKPLTEAEAKSVCRKHKTILYNGEWHDSLLLSVTVDEFGSADKEQNARPIASHSSGRGQSVGDAESGRGLEPHHDRAPANCPAALRTIA